MLLISSGVTLPQRQPVSLRKTAIESSICAAAERARGDRRRRLLTRSKREDRKVKALVPAFRFEAVAEVQAEERGWASPPSSGWAHFVS
jgi:hypothetical protein